MTQLIIRNREQEVMGTAGELLGFPITDTLTNGQYGVYRWVEYIMPNGVISGIAKKTGDGKKFRQKGHEALRPYMQYGLIKRGVAKETGDEYFFIDRPNGQRIYVYARPVSAGYSFYFLKKGLKSGKAYAVPITQEFANLVGGVFERDVEVVVKSPVKWLKANMHKEPATFRGTQPSLPPKKISLELVKDLGYQYITQIDPVTKKGGNKINADESNRRHILNEESKDLRSRRSGIFGTKWVSKTVKGAEYINKIINIGILKEILPKSSFQYLPNDGGYDTRDVREEVQEFNNEMTLELFSHLVNKGQLSLEDAEHFSVYIEEIATQQIEREEKMTQKEAVAKIKQQAIAPKKFEMPKAEYIFNKRQEGMDDYFEIPVIMKRISFNDIKGDELDEWAELTLPEYIEWTAKPDRIKTKGYVLEAIYCYIHKDIIQELRSVCFYDGTEIEIEREEENDVRDYSGQDYDQDENLDISGMAPDEMMMLIEEAGDALIAEALGYTNN